MNSSILDPVSSVAVQTLRNIIRSHRDSQLTAEEEPAVSLAHIGDIDREYFNVQGQPLLPRDVLLTAEALCQLLRIPEAPGPIKSETDFGTSSSKGTTVDSLPQRDRKDTSAWTADLAAAHEAIQELQNHILDMQQDKDDLEAYASLLKRDLAAQLEVVTVKESVIEQLEIDLEGARTGLQNSERQWEQQIKLEKRYNANREKDYLDHIQQLKLQNEELKRSLDKSRIERKGLQESLESLSEQVEESKRVRKEDISTGRLTLENRRLREALDEAQRHRDDLKGELSTTKDIAAREKERLEERIGKLKQEQMNKELSETSSESAKGTENVSNPEMEVGATLAMELQGVGEDFLEVIESEQTTTECLTGPQQASTQSYLTVQNEMKFEQPAKGMAFQTAPWKETAMAIPSGQKEAIYINVGQATRQTRSASVQTDFEFDKYIGKQTEPWEERSVGIQTKRKVVASALIQTDPLVKLKLDADAYEEEDLRPATALPGAYLPLTAEIGIECGLDHVLQWVSSRGVSAVRRHPIITMIASRALWHIVGHILSWTEQLDTESVTESDRAVWASYNALGPSGEGFMGCVEYGIRDTQLKAKQGEWPT